MGCKEASRLVLIQSVNDYQKLDSQPTVPFGARHSQTVRLATSPLLFIRVEMPVSGFHHSLVEFRLCAHSLSNVALNGHVWQQESCAASQRQIKCW